jgi:hypothetical protein
LGADVIRFDSTIYNLLVRHGWRKLMPRPFHPERHQEPPNQLVRVERHRLWRPGPSNR